MSSKSTIIKNTGFLYFRMLLVMGVSLYSSRILLESLGVDDYGLYNVIGGLVVMLSFLNGSASAATSRYLTFALGRKNDTRYDYQKLFSCAFWIHIALAVLIIIIGETIGLWYVYNKMVVPPGQLTSALWVYQISLFSVLISFSQVPYNASIIAHEKMSIYAYVGIYEAVTKLLIAYLIFIIPDNKLTVYAILVFIVYGSISIYYRIYCKRTFGNLCVVTLVKDKRIYKELLKFSGWDIIGNFGGAARSQGVNLILNLFCGPAVNAARAVAYQVEAGLSSFTTNFQTAVRPSIIKYYAQGETEKMVSLVYSTCKYSCILYSCVGIPIVLACQDVIDFWLKNPPEYTVPFVQIVVLTYLVVTINISLGIGVHATGDVKRLNIFGGSKVFLELPIIYFMLKSGFAPYWAFIILFISSSLIMFVDLYILKLNVPIVSFRRFIGKVLFPLFSIIIVASLITLIIPINEIKYNLLRIISCVIIYNTIMIPLFYYMGIDKPTRTKIIQKIKNNRIFSAS